MSRWTGILSDIQVKARNKKGENCALDIVLLSTTL